MKAIITFQHGSPDVLQLRDVPKPEPLPNEVLIHNRFVGVNFVDTQHRAGSYYPVVLPLIPGTEASGVVAAIGSDVTDFCVADIEEDPDRHFVNSMEEIPRSGCLSLAPPS
jgi:NADPH2:quinone reductase